VLESKMTVKFHIFFFFWNNALLSECFRNCSACYTVYVHYGGDVRPNSSCCIGKNLKKLLSLFTLFFGSSSRMCTLLWRRVGTNVSKRV
jgi:hypothetical protein